MMKCPQIPSLGLIICSDTFLLGDIATALPSMTPCFQLPAAWADTLKRILINRVLMNKAVGLAMIVFFISRFYSALYYFTNR